MSDFEEARPEAERLTKQSTRNAQRKKDAERDYTVGEWCEKRRISEPTFYKMLREGVGPETYSILGIRGPRITPASDRAWEKRMIALNKTKAARFERERRSKLAQHAAKISVQSPLHVSRAGKPGFKKTTTPAEPKRPKPAAVTPVAPGSSR